MKVYKLIKPDDYKGLFKVSLVDDPAIQSNLMAFEDEKPEFTFADDERQIIYAPAMIPNKLIFRKDINGEPANVYFDAETIKDLQIDYFRKNGNAKTNINHLPTDTDGVFSFENWIIEDAVQDKAYKMGFDVPVGTMMMGYKIDNAEVWADIKGGNIKGLSIEAQLLPQEEKVNFKNENMNKKGIIAKALEFFKESFKFEDMKDYGNGFFGSSLELGAIVTDADGNPMVNASFEFEGNKYTTDDMGAITQIEPIEEKEEEVEAAAEETPVEESTEEPSNEGSELEDAKALIVELETKIADLEAELAKTKEVQMSSEENTKSELVKMQDEILELKKIKNIPSEPNEENLSPLEKFRMKKKKMGY